VGTPEPDPPAEPVASGADAAQHGPAGQGHRWEPRSAWTRHDHHDDDPAGPGATEPVGSARRSTPAEWWEHARERFTQRFPAAGQAATPVRHRARWRVLHRLDPDGWTRAGFAAWLAWQVTTGRYTTREAWDGWVIPPTEHRYTRRQAHAVRKLRGLDGSERVLAQLYGWQSRRAAGKPEHERWGSRHGWVTIPPVGPRLSGGDQLDPAAPDTARPAAVDRAPRRWVRRTRLARRIVRGVASGSLRAAAVPAAWTVAAAVADRIDLTPTEDQYGRHSRGAEPAFRRRTQHDKEQ